MGKASLARKYSNLIAIAILILGLAFYLHRIDRWFMHDDEGSYAYAAWRISEGEMPYRDFLTPQLPLFLYWGGCLVKIFGPSILALRYATSLAALLAGLFVYLAAKEVFGPKAALLSLPLFIVHKDVYFVARFFRPEAYMLLFAAMGMYAFVLSYRRDGRWGFLFSGALFGLATLCKLFGVLPFAGCLLFLLYEALRSRERRAIGDALWLTGAFAAIAGTAFIVFQLISPTFLKAVLGHHLMQGRELSRLQVFLKGLRFYWAYFRGNPLFLLLAIPAMAKGLRAKAGLRALFPWQIPTVAAFLFLSRSLQDRHLVYLVPALSVLSASFLERLLDLKPIPVSSILGLGVQRKGSLGGLAKLALGLLLAGIALWPSWRKDLQVASWEEDDTWPLARYIQAHTREDDYVLSDYPGLNFYARRKTTYLGAGLSRGATSSGQITGQALIGEIEDKNVRMVLINSAGGAHQLVNLRDYANFRRYVQGHFHLVRQFKRSYQTIEIYHRDDLMPLRPEANFGGKLALTGADLGAGTAQAGGALSVTLRWQALSKMERDYTASLRLLDERGHLWGQRDTPLKRTFTSGWKGDKEVVVRAPTSRWASGEVTMDEYSLPVLPGTPPGEYQVKVVLYHLGSGERLDILGESGAPMGTEYTLGTVRVARPDEPPSPAELAIQHALMEDLEGEVQLWGYNLASEELRPGDALRLTLFWRALSQMERDWRLLLRIRGAQGEVLAEGEFALANADHPTSQWVEGEVVRGQYDLTLDPAAPPGEARLTLNLVDEATGQRLLGRDLALAELKIAGRRREFAIPEAIQHPLRANLGGRVALLGYDLDRVSVEPGGVLHLTLYWQALARIETSYTVFTHLLDGEGRIWGQKDSVPLQGAYPTTGWLEREVVVDEYDIAVRPEAPPGEYVLEIGMYNAATGERLPILDEKGRVLDNRILLAKIKVGE